MQDFCLPLQNRYDVLQTIVHKERQYLPQQHGIYLDKTLEGNKNKNGKKLGKNPCHNPTPDVTHSTTSRGNKNKTGNKSGQVTQELLHLDSTDQSMHHISYFRGNKNGPRAKLGEVHHKSANSDQAGTGNRSQRALTQDVVIQAPNISDISTGHDLACLEEEHNDNYVYLYEVSCSPVRRKRNIPEYIYSNKFSSQDYVKYVQQNGKDFGFLPLNDLMLYTGDDIIWTNIPSVIEAHVIVRKLGKPNFMGARIPLASQFNINAWKFYLAQYWDNQIVDLLQYGFPLDFDRSALLQSTYVNHSSALKFPDHVQKYIETEKKYGAILGPFDKFPFECHVSPFLTRHKPNNRRVILDLSFPQGKSVNDAVQKDIYLNTYFELNYPFVDAVVNRLKVLRLFCIKLILVGLSDISG